MRVAVGRGHIGSMAQADALGHLAVAVAVAAALVVVVSCWLVVVLAMAVLLTGEVPRIVLVTRRGRGANSRHWHRRRHGCHNLSVLAAAYGHVDRYRR